MNIKKLAQDGFCGVVKVFAPKGRDRKARGNATPRVEMTSEPPRLRSSALRGRHGGKAFAWLHVESCVAPSGRGEEGGVRGLAPDPGRCPGLSCPDPSGRG